MSVNDIYTRLRGVPEFNPASAELFDALTLQAGDVISVKSGTETFALPIFAQHLVWNGSAVNTVQSQGDEERAPLPALQRKLFSSGRGGYNDQKLNESEFKQFETFFEKEDEYFSWLATESEWDELAHEGRVTAYSQIKQTANAITLEVARATEAEGTLSSNITLTAEAITAEVTRATTAEGALGSRITQTADSITAEVTRATAAEGSLSSRITQTADSITAEVTRATTAEGNLSTRITQTADSITALVTKTGVNDLGENETLYSKITETASAITAEVTRATASEGTLSSRITQTATDITSLVTKTGVNNLGENETLYSEIQQTATDITSIVSKTGINSLGQGETLYSEIQQNATAITSKVSAGDIASTINQTAQSVLIQASKIDLQGYVTASQLSAVEADITNLTSGTTIATALSANTLEARNAFFVGNNQADWRTVKIGTVKSFSVLGSLPSATEQDFDHSHSITLSESGGVVTATLGAAVTTSDSSRSDFFNIADTQFYQDGVSAAYQQGVIDGGASAGSYAQGVIDGENAVTIVKNAWDRGQIIFSKSSGTASNGYVNLAAGSQVTWGTGANANRGTVTIYDVYNNQSLDTGATATVDATPRYTAGYNTGYSEGESDGETAGQNAVTITKGAWSNGQISFRKSAGTASTKSVALSAGNASWNGNTATVTIYDVDGGGSLNTGTTVTVDASARYTAGYNAGETAGENAVTITKGSWSNGQISFSKSAGTASTKYVSISAGSTVTWGTGANANKGSVVIYDVYGGGSLDTGKTATVDATPRYNAGHSAGEDSVTVSVMGVANETFISSTKEYEMDGFCALSNGLQVTRTVAIDASDAWNAGYSAGQGSVTIPTVTSVTRDSSRSTTYSSAVYTMPITISFSNGTTASATVNFSISNSSYNSSTKKYTITVAGNSDRTLDASAAYTAGATANAGIRSLNMVAITEAAWNGMYADVSTKTVSADRRYLVTATPVSGTAERFKFRTPSTT